MRFWTKMKLAAMVFAALLLIGATGATTHVVAADNSTAPPAPAIAPVPATPEPEATKLRVALAQVEKEMAQLKLDSAQANLTRMEEAHKIAAISMAELDQAKLELQLAKLNVKAAGIKMEQAKLGPEQPITTASQDSDVELATAQFDVAEVERDMAQAKADHCEAIRAMMQKGLEGNTVTPRQLEDATYDAEVAKLNVKLADIRSQQAVRALDRARARAEKLQP